MDRLANVLGSLLTSSPAFLTGLVLSLFLAVKARVFPVTGWVHLSDDVPGNLRSVALGAITLGLAEMVVFMRVLRSDMIATLQDDYILAARAKGLSPFAVLTRHALRQSLFSLVTLAGLSLGRLLGGAVIVESLFGLPGIGQLIINSILNKDFVTVQGVTMFVAIVYVVINAAVDVGYGVLDPRVRTSA